MDRVQTAVENHKKGYNCCQAVACAFCDEVDIDENTMFMLTEGFGLGMGDMQGVCGAISGAAVILSLKYSGGIGDTASKKETYKIIRKLKEKFRNKNGSDICCDIKGVKNGGTPLRSCRGCVEDAAQILEELLKN